MRPSEDETSAGAFLTLQKLHDFNQLSEQSFFRVFRVSESPGFLGSFRFGLPKIMKSSDDFFMNSFRNIEYVNGIYRMLNSFPFSSHCRLVE